MLERRVGCCTRDRVCSQLHGVAGFKAEMYSYLIRKGIKQRSHPMVLH